MNSYLGWTLAIAVLIGHFGLMLSIYNRINGFGLPRRLIKRCVKFFFVYTILLPPAILWIHWDLIWDVVSGRPEGLLIPLPLMVYSTLCLATWPLMGIPWLLWRPIWGIEWVRASRKVEVIDVESATQMSLARSTKCKWECRLPLNQIFELAIEEIELPVAGLPTKLDGYRIAHLSDVHLTGDVHLEFTKHVVQQAIDWRPDMMALTGDIIDSLDCVAWLHEIFAPATCLENATPDGCFFVLGNHDTRIDDPQLTRNEMKRAGWIDLGGRSLSRTIRGTESLFIGNEHPWFARPDLPEQQQADEEFRLLLSHSPDQLAWARKRQVKLMLAGHTHGGQGRLPIIGPLLSPSFHGSRYASGDFYKPPTTLHVSRGLAGTHLVRIHCRPELSLLTLRSVGHDDGGT